MITKILLVAIATVFAVAAIYDFVMMILKKTDKVLYKIRLGQIFNIISGVLMIALLIAEKDTGYIGLYEHTANLWMLIPIAFALSAFVAYGMAKLIKFTIFLTIRVIEYTLKLAKKVLIVFWKLFVDAVTPESFNDLDSFTGNFCGEGEEDED